nr:hypothetical protein [Pseudomonas luteola]
MSTTDRSLDIISMPVISNHHLDDVTASRLLSEGDNNPWCLCATYQTGMILELGDVDLEKEIPRCLIDLRHWLQDRNFPMWVMLEPAGVVHPDLPLYDW